MAGRAVPLFIPNNMQYSNGVLTPDSAENRQGLKICEEGVKVLKNIGDNEVKVISIYGNARCGKSYLLSKLGGVKFNVSHSIKVETVGIWIGTFRLDNTNSTVILLDCEGTDSILNHHNDVGFNSEQQMLSICYLLSSVMLYNCNGVTLQLALHKLQHVANYIDLMYSNDANGLPQYSKPCLWWLFRNSTLLSDNEDEWGSFKDEVFQNESLSQDTRDLIDSIEKGFCQVRTTMLRPPSTDPRVCANLDLPEYHEQLRPFQSDISEFKGELFACAEIKQMGGIPLTGTSLAEFVTKTLQNILTQQEFPSFEKIWGSYVNSITNGAQIASRKVFILHVNTFKLPLTIDVLERKCNIAKELAEMVFYRKARIGRTISNAKEHFKSFFKTDLKSNLDAKIQNNDSLSRHLCMDNYSAKIRSLSEREFSLDVFTAEGLEMMISSKASLLSEYEKETTGYPHTDDVKIHLADEIDKKLFKKVRKMAKQNMLEHCHTFFILYVGKGDEHLQSIVDNLEEILKSLSINPDNVNMKALHTELKNMVEEKDRDVRIKILCAIIFSVISLLVLYKEDFFGWVYRVSKTSISSFVTWINNHIAKVITKVVSEKANSVSQKILNRVLPLIQSLITDLTEESTYLLTASLQNSAARLFFQPVNT